MPVTETYKSVEAAMQAVNTEGNLTGWPEHLKQALHHLEEARIILRDAPASAEPTTNPGAH